MSPSSWFEVQGYGRKVASYLAQFKGGPQRKPLGLEGWVRLRLVSGMKWGCMGKGAKEVMDLFSVWLRDIRIPESLLPGLSQY